METLRSIKIIVEIDTNKATYRESFDDSQIKEMFDWLEDYTGTDYRQHSTGEIKIQVKATGCTCNAYQLENYGCKCGASK